MRTRKESYVELRNRVGQDRGLSLKPTGPGWAGPFHPNVLFSDIITARTTKSFVNINMDRYSCCFELASNGKMCNIMYFISTFHLSKILTCLYLSGHVFLIEILFVAII
jgi:hypothetical protein